MPTSKGYHFIIPTMPATYDGLRSLRAKLPAILDGLSVDKVMQDDVLLVVTEHVTNLIKHCSGVNFSIAVRQEPASLLIQDNGPSIEDKLMNAPDVDALVEQSALNESGMGLSLIKTLFPDLSYRSESISGVPTNYLAIPLSAAVKPCVAVIDDDLSQLVMLESFLEDKYRVYVFSDPLSALNDIPEMDLSLIICDVKMPVMTGLELREKLLSYPAIRMVPFIFLSGVGEDEIHEKASHLLIDDFIRKPVVKKTLERAITRILYRLEYLKHTLEVELDKNITHSLWSQLPSMYGGYALDCSYKVASRGGGDFVFSSRRENSLLIVLGDIMGHGEQAKFFSFALSGYYHGLCLAQGEGLSVSDVLRSLSANMMHSELLKNTLVTCLAIEVFSDGRIELASAGHPAPWLIGSDGSITEIDVGGMLPGVLEEVVYVPVMLKLKPGECLMSYTDGLIEDVLHVREGARLDGAMEKFKQKTEALTSLGAQGLLSHLADENKDLGDDVTIVTLASVALS